MNKTMGKKIGIHNISHVLLDIEGTTCPISFVTETLFPYASEHMGAYLQSKKDDPDVIKLVSELNLLWQNDNDEIAKKLFESLGDNNERSLINYLGHLIRTDKKATALKELQGKIWAQGYEQGQLVGPLFDDVPIMLQQWNQQGLKLGVYSSGSIEAQQLIYGYSNAGDLRPCFHYWFDTNIGAKQCSESYTAICRQMECENQHTLFISDSASELHAAQSVGLHVIMSQREGNPNQPDAQYLAIQSFEELALKTNQ